MTYRPVVLRWWVIGFSSLLIVATGLGWWAIGPEQRAMYRLWHIATILFLVAVLLWGQWLLVISRVTVDATGVSVRNGHRRHRWTWDEIAGVRYRDGDPWPSLLFREGDDIVRRQLLGIQRTDRERADAAVADLRTRLAASRNQPEG